jgi:regulator of sigma E protease
VSVLIAILGLAFLILVHEAGHFFTARAVGMRPRRFYIGFPPALVKVKRKGIEYGIGAIPLGGYVKIPGMHRPAPSDVELHFARPLREAPQLVGPIERLKRRLAEGDLDGASAELAPLEAAVEGASLTPETHRAAGRGLQEIADGLGEDAYWRQKTWKRVTVIFAGPATNLVLAIALFTGLFMVGGGKATSTVDHVVAGRPAAAIGLRPGDRVIAINRIPVTPTEIPSQIGASRGGPVTVLVQRGGQFVTLGPARPRLMDGAYRLGFVLRGEDLGFAASLWHSVRLTGLVTREIGRSIGRLVHGQGRKDISSPVGIVQGSSDALNQGIQTYLWVLGLISLSLALLNLLPLLPLDGGHIAFSIIEGLRGRAVGREIYERVSVIGIALVLFLFFIGLSNDINRIGHS